VQNKVLEAMAMAKPVIATQAATRALAVMPGVHLWIEDSPLEFANAVVAAVESADRFHIAQSARDFVERHHDWTRNLTALDDLLTEGCKGLSDADEELCRPHHASEGNFAAEKSANQTSSADALQ
jgi:glycosyltransferase involved in cell wall biosynthesis